MTLLAPTEYSGVMKYDLYRFTKFGLVNALWSLVPIFPTWTIFPGVVFAALLGKFTGDCELGYLITLWGSFCIAAVLLVWYFRRFDIDGRSEKQLKKEFRLICLAVYSLINTGLLIAFVGINSACYGDGQTFLVVIYSGPLTSVGLIALGFGVDVKVSVVVARGEDLN